MKTSRRSVLPLLLALIGLLAISCSDDEKTQTAPSQSEEAVETKEDKDWNYRYVFYSIC